MYYQNYTNIIYTLGKVTKSKIKIKISYQNNTSTYESMKH